MRLTDKEREIFGYVQLEANAPLWKIKRATGFREHTIRYCMQKLQGLGLSSPRPFLDLSPLGLTEHVLYFSISPATRRRMPAIAGEIAGSGGAAWLASFSGAYEYALGVWARDSIELNSTMDLLISRWGMEFSAKALSARTSARLFRRGYLSSLKPSVEALTCGEQGPLPARPEPLDLRILKSLCSEYRTRAEIAERLKIPASTLSYRIGRLEERKVILGWYYPVQSRSLGMHGFRLLAQLRGISPRFREAFCEYCASHTRVLELIGCVGGWDYELKVELEHAEQMIPFLHSLNERFPEINELTVLTTLSEARGMGLAEAA